MPEDKIIKTGQITFARLFFLAVFGALLFITVATGKLAIGYLVLNLVLSTLLMIIAFDRRISLQNTEAGPTTSLQSAATTATEPEPVIKDPRVRRRGSRPVKRRR